MSAARAGLLAFAAALACFGSLRAAMTGVRRMRRPLPSAPVARGGTVSATRWPRRLLGVVNARRAIRRYSRGLPLALDASAAALRSGSTLAAALEDAGRTVGGPLGDDLRALARQAAQGGMAVALAGWKAARPLPAVRVAAAAWSMGADTGGRLAAALEGLAASLRARASAAAEARALSSQARLSGIVIGVAPVAFCLFTASTDQNVSGFLLRSPVGVACLVAGLALDGLGAWWMTKITSGAVP